jgi:hypothetical protein
VLFLCCIRVRVLALYVTLVLLNLHVHKHVQNRMDLNYYPYHHHHHGSTRWRSWLKHCATNRKVAGSIPDIYIYIGIFHWHNLFGHPMALGSTQPLTPTSTRNISWRGNLTNFTCRMSRNLGASISWNPQGLSRPVQGWLNVQYYLMWSELTWYMWSELRWSYWGQKYHAH